MDAPNHADGFGRWIDSIRINRVWREVRDGRAVWVKERMPSARWILPLANRFFAWADNPVRVLGVADGWPGREVDLLRALHGEGCGARVEGDALVVPEFPGTDLSALMEAGIAGPDAFRAAGRELRRLHGIPDPDRGGCFSHGDPHLANFIVDPDGGNARLIDFEVRHREGMPERDRFADDLLVFLQDMAGRIERERWLPSALAFLGGYGDGEVVTAFRGRLRLPGGFARIWWAVRTTYMRGAELRSRLGELRAATGGAAF